MQNERSPDHRCIYLHAEAQHGYFTAAQARTCGFDGADLAYHTNTGKFTRVRRGIYRLRDYPPFYREHVVIPWVELGIDRAVVSHQSALDLLELSDVIPSHIHLTVPRSMRYRTRRPDVMIHTTTRTLGPNETTIREGIRITSPAVTIADAAEIGVGPEQIEMAVHQALERGITTERQLRGEAHLHSVRVRDLIDQAIRWYPG
jgi:predicted transcriptional regulator of viral defense system